MLLNDKEREEKMGMFDPEQRRAANTAFKHQGFTETMNLPFQLFP